MLITLVRDASENHWTLGRLSVDGRFHCYTCEDVVRPPGEPKVPGQTAIPAGRYRVIVTVSPRFSRLAKREVRLPRLVGVPGFEGILIHPGNTHEHTEGCILPGRSYSPHGVTQSQGAFNSLFGLIEAAIDSGEQVWIEIANATDRKPVEPAQPRQAAPVAAGPQPAATTPAAPPLPPVADHGQG